LKERTVRSGFLGIKMLKRKMETIRKGTLIIAVGG